MNGDCKHKDSEEIRKAIYYYPESCPGIEFSIAVCLSMRTLDSSLQYHLDPFRFYGLAYGTSFINCTSSAKYAMVTGEIKVAMTVSSGIMVTKAIAKSVVSYTNCRRHQNVKYQ
jgi:hypothetical protein